MEKDLQIIIADALSKNGYQNLDSFVLGSGQIKLNGSSYIYEELLESFLRQTQPDLIDAYGYDEIRMHILASLNNRFLTPKITGLLGALKHGVNIRGRNIKLLYPKTEDNIFSVQTEVVNKDESSRVDLVLAINGLPLVMIELKNISTGQNFEDAEIEWTDRDLENPLYQSNSRALLYFALDNYRCSVTTDLKKQFIPFNRFDPYTGETNPILDDNGRTLTFPTSYLWQEFLTPDSLLNLIFNYLCLSGDKIEDLFIVMPRYHQFEAVRNLLAMTESNMVDATQKYLLQHSTGSGKTYTMMWLAFELYRRNSFDKIFIINDSLQVDKQLYSVISKMESQFFGSRDEVVVNAESTAKSSDDSLETYLSNPTRRIIVTTVQKINFLYEYYSKTKGNNPRVAVIIDESHRGSMGKMAANLDAFLELENFAYYAFTGTPTTNTLIRFGKKDDNSKLRRPHHVYSMRQALDEGYILDPMLNYVPVDKDFHFDDGGTVVTVSGVNIKDSLESPPEVIEFKSRWLLEYFKNNTMNKINGTAKAIVVTSSIMDAINYKKSLDKIIEENHDDFKTIVAFSGKKINGKMYTENDFNDMPSAKIPEKFHNKNGKYKILIVANKFQTGFDEPLLYTMFLDKNIRSGVAIIQTLSRLNRIHEDKNGAEVVDFRAFDNKPFIEKAQEDYELEFSRSIEEITNYSMATFKEKDLLLREKYPLFYCDSVINSANDKYKRKNYEETEEFANSVILKVFTPLVMLAKKDLMQLLNEISIIAEELLPTGEVGKEETEYLSQIVVLREMFYPRFKAITTSEKLPKYKQIITLPITGVDFVTVPPTVIPIVIPEEKSTGDKEKSKEDGPVTNIVTVNTVEELRSKFGFKIKAIYTVLDIIRTDESLLKQIVDAMDLDSLVKDIKYLYPMFCILEKFALNNGNTVEANEEVIRSITKIIYNEKRS